MVKKDKLNLLKEISEVKGVSGFEVPATLYVKKYLKDCVSEFDYDNLGSLISVKKSKKKNAPKILFTAHIDEVGFIVSKIEENGYIKFEPIGGWWGHVALAQRYIITTADGKEYLGVTGSKPPHGMGMDERSKVLDIKHMFLDIGVKNKKEVLDLGINVGDVITPDSKFATLANPRFLLGKAWDDRICVAATMEMLKDLKNEELNCDLYVASTVQEEVGLRGAKTATYRVKPDIGIALDVTMSNDLPGSSGNDTKLGSGIALSIMDRSVIAHNGLRHFVEKICKENKIPYTLDVLPAGGTDSGEIHKSFDGIINMTISIPCRYFHSHISVIDLEDYNNLVKVITLISKKVDSKVLKELREFKK